MNRILRDFLILVCLLIIIFFAVLGLGSALIPLLASFAGAYLFFPLIQKLEHQGINRRLLVVGIFLLFTFFSLLVTALFLPVLINESVNFVQTLPESTLKAIEKVQIILGGWGYSVNVSVDSLKSLFITHQSTISSGLIKGITTSLNLAFSGITSWLIAILNIFLVPLFFFYLIIDFEKISDNLVSMIPRSALPKMTYYLKVTDTVLSGYIRGQIMVALILSLIYSVGLSLIGLQFGLAIGICAGLLSIIPYVGFTIGLVSSIVMGLAHFDGIGTFVGIAIVFGFGQLLESFWITPKLVGDKVGLSPLATVLALIIGGNLLGFIGMLIAIPTVGIAKHIFLDLKTEYQNSDLYK